MWVDAERLRCLLAAVLAAIGILLLSSVPTDEPIGDGLTPELAASSGLEQLRDEVQGDIDKLTADLSNLDRAVADQAGAVDLEYDGLAPSKLEGCGERCRSQIGILGELRERRRALVHEQQDLFDDRRRLNQLIEEAAVATQPPKELPAQRPSTDGWLNGLSQQPYLGPSLIALAMTLLVVRRKRPSEEPDPIESPKSRERLRSPRFTQDNTNTHCPQDLRRKKEAGSLR